MTGWFMLRMGNFWGGPSRFMLDLRLPPQAKSRLQAAAVAAQRSVSDFVLDSALSRADEVLADRRIFGL